MTARGQFLLHGLNCRGVRIRLVHGLRKCLRRLLANADLRGDHGYMKSHRPRTWLLYLVGIFVVVMTGLWVINALLGLLFKLFIGAIIVIGAVYLVGRPSRRRLESRGPLD
jgi:hypothetical protein